MVVSLLHMFRVIVSNGEKIFIAKTWEKVTKGWPVTLATAVSTQVKVSEFWAGKYMIVRKKYVFLVQNSFLH